MQGNFLDTGIMVSENTAAKCAEFVRICDEFFHNVSFRWDIGKGLGRDAKN